MAPAPPTTRRRAGLSAAIGVPRREGRSSLRAAAILVGTIIATLVAWSPGLVGPALAAGTLLVQGDSTYTVDADAGSVHVVVELTVTNNKPNTDTVLYYYRDVTFGVQPEARAVRASDAGGALGATTRSHRFYTEVTVRLRANLYYGRSTAFTLRYDLVGGAPRSDSPVRVGEAFTTFGVWAFGDPGKGTVEVRLPPGFSSTVDGDAMRTTSTASGQVLRAAPDDPNAFYAIVTAENRDRYRSDRLSLAGGVEIVVLSWPEDRAWQESVRGTLSDGIPRLRALIGLDWPVTRDLTIRERYTPALEGYAGIFYLDDQRIDVSEDLDPITTLHEASHAWFNDALFAERWIYEGLAEDYATRVDAAIDGAPAAGPPPPDPAAAGAAPLNGWRFPEIVRDETDDVELYGYAASWWLVHEIVDAAGTDQMRTAFANAATNRTAYPGAGAPEAVDATDGWQRFLDLTEPIAQGDPATVLDGVARLVLDPAGDGVLERRAAARDAYRELLTAGDGWLPPWYVREPMGAWRFEEAGTRIDEALDVLRLRDDVATAAAAQDLDPGDDLRTAYEGSQDGLAAASSLAASQLEAIAAIAAAHADVDAEPDLLARIGLLGEAPRGAYEAARAAFDAGDIDLAIAQAGIAAAIVAGAPALGQERLVLGALVVAGALMLLLLARILLRRRRRQVAGEAGEAGAAVMASGTLGADPEGPPPPNGEGPPGAEGLGGPPRGDPPPVARRVPPGVAPDFRSAPSVRRLSR